MLGGRAKARYTYVRAFLLTCSTRILYKLTGCVSITIESLYLKWYGFLEAVYSPFFRYYKEIIKRSKKIFYVQMFDHQNQNDFVLGNGND